MKRTLAIMLTLAVSLVLSSAARAESASVLLEKAIYTEETVGDVDAAIKLYQDIIDTAQADRRAVAEAHYRLGMCCLKKDDKTSAIQALRTVLVEFPREKEIAQNAKIQLAELGVTASASPVVIRTAPRAFANDVSTDLTEITVTFDRPMMDGSWSWTGGGDTFPKITGKIHYDAARRTCTLPVQMEPSKVYVIGINSPSHKNFKTAAGVPAQGYVILFATKGSDGKPTPLPEDLMTWAKDINTAGPPTAAQAPPLVVSTTPPAFAADVSPDLVEITATFDQPMLDKSWSWTGGGDTFPKITGKIHYDDARRTCTLPVKLEPGKVYWIGVNSPSHRNFQTPKRVPAQRYVLLFATKGADGTPTPLPEDRLARAKAINAAHENAADKAPPKDETQLAKERDSAIAKGDLIAAIDAEMQRVLLREKTGHAYKDKIDLVSAYEGFVEKHAPSGESLSRELKNVQDYLESHKGDVEHEWRVYHLLSAMSKDLDAPGDAARHLDQALESYPAVHYTEPSKHSKFQHLVNQRAGLIWDSDGPEAAEEYVLEQLRTNEKCDFFFSGWWKRRFEMEGTQDRLLPLLRRVEDAYLERMKNVPSKGPLCRRYISRLKREISELE